ncbi:helix-turn-helix transcriptional regulator [Microbacterium foliorum]|uniref:Helix-turn-helix transcriptional regulator n=1 Tax=Microbacterium foliorum TaxID=104336 RepID=A0A4Y5YQN0_9MICO|nr:helix-turn-helix transcriptional regulator [Microbacterium foliorum]QDE34836.1 helix-turn-helix transcriptional regulator [Microbacterium foliorum]
MIEQRRIGYNWNLRQIMAQRNLWKSSDLMPLLKARGINLSESQVWRLVTGTPEKFTGRTLAALCDILECGVGDLFEPYVEMKAARTATAPRAGEKPPSPAGGPSLTHRIRLVEDDDGQT